MYPDGIQDLNYETSNAVYFFTTAFDPLNNWSAHAVIVWGETFPTLEHAYHCKKFETTAPDIVQQILVAPSPWAAMQIERAHKAQRRKDWQDIKLSVMEELLRAKVAQHQDVQECLRRTGSRRIIENSPWDSFWGSGSDGKGQNHVGLILMKIRGELLGIHAPDKM